MKNVMLVSKENWIPIPNKNNRKNKHRKIYSWKLEKASRTDEQIFDQKEIEDYAIMDITPKVPYGQLQDLKQNILSEINQKSLFDFEYVPKELDILNIYSLKEHDDYLNLIFFNGNWIEDGHFNSFRNNRDKYSEYKIGFVEL